VLLFDIKKSEIFMSVDINNVAYSKGRPASWVAYETTMVVLGGLVRVCSP